MNVTISIPAYNEEETLPLVIKSIREVMSKQEDSYSLVVVDDGSTDQTPVIAKKLGANVYSHPRNYGLAETFKTEISKFLESKSDVFVHIDADGQYDPKDIPRLIQEIKNGHDLVLGSRFTGKIESMPLMKRLGNKAFAKVLSRLTKTKLTDTTTGFRAFTRDVAEKINFTNTFTYTQEQIIHAIKQKFSIKEIPIHSRKTRESRLFGSTLEYAWKAWINILKIYRDYDPLKFFGRIGGALFIIGVILGIYIIYNVIATGKAGGIPRVILSGVLILTGIQIISFGFLADMRKK